jgi:hypothetical protein
MLKKIWHDSVWSKVIAQGIIDVIKTCIVPVVLVFGAVAVAFLTAFLTGLWPKIFGFFQKSILFVLSSSQVPNWLLLILGVTTVLYGIKMGRTVIHRFVSKENEPAWKSYTEDLIEDIRWRWTYKDNIYIPEQLASFCSKCDCMIIPNNTSSGPRREVRFICENCNEVIRFPQEYSNDVLQRVTLKIERKIRKRLWLIKEDLSPT